MTNAVSAYASQDQATSYDHITTAAGELAVLLIETESAQANSEQAARQSARQTYLTDAAQQATELHDAASAIATGALVGAAFTVAGGICTIESAHLQASPTVPANPAVPADQTASKTWAAVGTGLTNLAQPAKALVGDSTAENDRASAKEWETRGETARWTASDAQTELDALNRRSDKVLDLLQNINQDQNAAANAVIGRI
ncbi:MAG TPA: hypothetical protein VGI10_29740 [Polyangiaceae bacterium]|jgi:hypothetical protein